MPSRTQSTDLTIMSFLAFCDAVDASPNLWPAPLVKTCTYIEKDKPIAPHRCLIVDICLGSGGHACLRLDRRPTGSIALASGKGVTKSNDEVMIANRIADLKLDNYKLENVQIFPDSPPTVVNLNRVLRAFSTTVTRYSLLSENCWFLCSVLEELLPSNSNGLYAAGDHRNLHLGQRSRNKVTSTLNSNGETLHSATPMSLPNALPFPNPSIADNGVSSPSSSLLQGAFRCTHQSPVEMYATSIALYLRDSVHLSPAQILSLSRMLKRECVFMLREVHWDGVKEYGNHVLALHLYEYGDHLFDSKSYLKAAEVTSQSVEMTRVLYRDRPDLHQEDFPRRLNLLGVCYDWGTSYGSACMHQGEAVKLWRTLAKRDPIKYTVKLALALFNYGLALHGAVFYQAACDVKAESVDLTRQLYQQDSEAHASDFAWRLFEYGVSLYELKSYGDMHTAIDESVKLTRKLHEEHPEIGTHISDLARRLYTYGFYLHALDRFRDACEAKAEAVELTRQLCHRNPDSDVYAADLIRRLDNYNTSLFEGGLYSEACSSSTELIALTRQRHQQNPDIYTVNLALRLQVHGTSLRKCGSLKKACGASAESVALMRELHQQDADPGDHASTLALCLCTHGISLYNCGSFHEACDILAESIALMRQLHQHPNSNTHYTSQFAETLHYYGLALHAAGRYQEALDAT